VQAGAVVPGRVLYDRPACQGARGPGLNVDQLAFERGEERFGQGVVPALAGPADRQDDLVPVGQGGELRPSSVRTSSSAGCS